MASAAASQSLATSYNNAYIVVYDDTSADTLHRRQLALIDELVESGIAANRSAVIRRGVHHLAESVRRARVGASIAASYREQPQTPEDDEFAVASAVAMTEAEPW